MNSILTGHGPEYNFFIMGENMGILLEEITERIKEHKEELSRRYCIREIGVFGSCVRGEAKAGSDIDMLIDTEEPLDLFRFLELEERLSELTGGKVDLVSKKALKPEIGKMILQEVKYL
jgi:uncharacterized protein